MSMKNFTYFCINILKIYNFCYCPEMDKIVKFNTDLRMMESVSN